MTIIKIPKMIFLGTMLIFGFISCTINTKIDRSYKNVKSNLYQLKSLNKNGSQIFCQIADVEFKIDRYYAENKHLAADLKKYILFTLRSYESATHISDTAVGEVALRIIHDLDSDLKYRQNQDGTFEIPPKAPLRLIAVNYLDNNHKPVRGLKILARLKIVGAYQYPNLTFQNSTPDATRAVPPGDYIFWYRDKNGYEVIVNKAVILLNDPQKDPIRISN